MSEPKKKKRKKHVVQRKTRWARGRQPLPPEERLISKRVLLRPDMMRRLEQEALFSGEASKNRIIRVAVEKFLRDREEMRSLISMGR